MKKTARLICLVLCLATLVACFSFVGCGGTGNSTGAYINMYLSNEVYNFDPAYAHLDTSSMKLLPLLYEGLMKLDSKGKVVNGLCEDWDYDEDLGVNKDPAATEDDTYTMTIDIKTTAWSDGIPLSADDFIFAWKRLLEPDFDGEGAELLYDIKGAIERKTLADSSYDIGLYAQQQTLIIEFAHSIDPDEFLRKLTSIALVPLRESAVTHYAHWSSASTSILTNGPFTIRTYEPGQQLVIERNIYYKHDATDKENEPIPDKTVKPYRIVIDYTLSDEEVMQKYEDGQLFFMSELPASTDIRNTYKNKVDASDAYNMCTYYFNTNVAPFDNPVVRKALSDVIDREAIANAVVFAKAATGLVPSAVRDMTKKDSFAANNDAKLSTVAADISAAKNAIKAAGVNPEDFGTLYLTVRDNANTTKNESSGNISFKSSTKETSVDLMIAKMVVEQWNKLGFDFEIKTVSTTQYKEITSELVQYTDAMVGSMYGYDYVMLDERNVEVGENIGDSAEENGFTYTRVDSDNINVTADARKFDVIAIDYQMLDTTAFSMLSVFAEKFSGCQISFNNEDLYTPYGHITGYNSEAYNKLIDEAYEAYKAGDKALYSQKLHEAEKMLLNDMPVIPIIEYRNIVLKSSKLSKIGYSAWGGFDFKSAKLKNWQEYVPSDED